MAQGLARLNDAVNNAVWGPAMLCLLLGTGIYLTMGTGFFQLRRFGQMWRGTVGELLRPAQKRTRGDGVTPFQAVSTAVAGTLGVGNVAGVATALVSGGPGAVFWMWVSAFFGMMTKYAEVVLAVHFRRRDEQGHWCGGPMYYMEEGLGSRGLAVAFSLFGAAACFGIGNMSQANEVAAAMESTLGWPRLVTGLGAALFVGLVILGGIGRIASVTARVVPLMALFYMAGSLAVLAINAPLVGDAFSAIFQDAFRMEAAGGGVAGFCVSRAVRYGIARGVFSNEAGMGSASIAHAAADTDSAVHQGLWGIFEVFLDTIVICTITALVLLTSGLPGVLTDPGGRPVSGGALTSAAFEQALGPLGGTFVSVAIVFFALATMLGWSYYGERCVAYLTGNSATAIRLYRCAYIALAAVGAVGRLDVIWKISDTLNGMMALPNLTALLCLSGTVFRLTKEHQFVKKSRRHF